MALVNMRDMLNHAYENSYAVGAFDLVSLDFLEVVINAAERSRSPVILSLAEPHFVNFDFDLIMPAVEAAARRAEVPVAIQLDHGSSIQSAIDAINLGCNGVMVDVSHKTLPENIRDTQSVVEMAHKCGVPVVGELGYVAGLEGDGKKLHPGEISYTAPAEAKIYVERTGVDFLAVSIGTVQGRVRGKPKLDFQRLKQINSAVKIPLVVHGGSGLSEDQVRKLSSLGVVKINYFTALADIAGQALRNKVENDKTNNYVAIKKDVKQKIGEEVEHCMRAWGSAGRAAEVLAQCEPWAPIEHLIIYNVDEGVGHAVDNIMMEGRRVLSSIPGVREVFTGKAVKEEAKFHYTWLVRFVHPAVIESYRYHPAHVSFADRLFRPIAADRISIDYQEVTESYRQGGIVDPTSIHILKERKITEKV